VHLLFVGIGLAAGVLAGLFGIGGGIVIVPALAWAARMPMATATGTSLAALLLPVGALGAWEYWKRGQVQVVPAALVALGIAAGAWIGARLVGGLAPATHQRLFAILLAAVAVRLWLTAR
jgi:uncharacterized membrane protein YfcA